MDVAFVIWQRLAALGREQRDLARAAEVTESYIKPLKFKDKRPTALSYYREWQNLQIPAFAHAIAGARERRLSRALRWHHDQEPQQRLGDILRHVLVIKTRRARRKGGDIRQLLLPQHRAEPRGNWRSGTPVM